jgi:hypothetical protein
MISSEKGKHKIERPIDKEKRERRSAILIWARRKCWVGIKDSSGGAKRLGCEKMVRAIIVLVVIRRSSDRVLVGEQMVALGECVWEKRERWVRSET